MRHLLATLSTLGKRKTKIMLTAKPKFEEGTIVKIRFRPNVHCYGRLFPGFHLAVYDKKCIDDEIVDSNEIPNNKILFYARLFEDVIRDSAFEIVGFKKLSNIEIKNLPPHFEQDKVDI